LRRCRGSSIRTSTACPPTCSSCSSDTSTRDRFDEAPFRGKKFSDDFVTFLKQLIFCQKITYL
jgi:hypothetical protein